LWLHWRFGLLSPFKSEPVVPQIDSTLYDATKAEPYV
jgi:hypothetical protein